MTNGLGFLEGGGAATQLILGRDWTGHPLGEPKDWPVALKSALSLVLNSPESMILSWGPELSFFFNETYFPLLGPRLSWAMGERFDKVWADGWEQAKPIIDAAFAGKPERFTDLYWNLGEDRGARDTWWSFSYSRVLDADGNIAGLFIFTNETTERYLGDIALRESQERYRLLNASLEEEVARRVRERDRLWESTSDLVATATLAGTLTAVNPAWSKTLGWSAETLLARPFIEIVDPADHAETADVVRRLAAGETVTGFVDRLIASDGSRRTVMWTAVPEPQSDVFYIIGRDMTEQQAAQDQLRQAQKMEAVGQLTGGVAHDFNNLLAGISGSLEMIDRRLAQGRATEVGKYVAAAQTATSRAAALTHRLLAFSRRQTLDPRPTDVMQLIAGIEDMVRRTIGPAIRLDIVAARDKWITMVDPPQLENALLNLCINARDAMPDGGTIHISTDNVLIDRTLSRLHELPEGPYLCIKVGDTGTGMDAATIAKAFEPFFTTKPIGEGTGLGLSMVYGFAKQSGGQVRIHSTPGHGTTISLYLPRYLGAEEALQGSRSALPLPAAQGETILLVDDEPLVRMLMSEALQEIGYQVIEAGDGAEGLAVAQSDRRIDMLVTDVGLPGNLNGKQMADAVRQVRPGLPVLFITGYAENTVLNGDHLDEGTAVLTKPFPMESIGLRVRDMLDNR